MSGSNAEFLVEQLGYVLETLSEREVEVIRPVFNGFSLSDVGKTFGISSDRVRHVHDKAMRKLRHPTRSEILRDYFAYDTFHADDTLYEVLQHLDKSAFRRTRQQTSLEWCDHHGWTELRGRPRCGSCSCELPPEEEMFGRYRRYCCNACKQRAYRQR
ncbi:sigma factor-like helix-turn-helix DNA-binding protein [Nocardia jiangxiensis]|uniref:Sigma factor-like helix-turn-helix DNA-binding protein n=1 Tax=Nocardia jiangxiensis TaxID=282685 RepID=A0ABW6SFB6_9NOCA|nr:sigma factor-like helix-turn-helix DNA-binding protein [Nocardia jiangxiensis]